MSPVDIQLQTWVKPLATGDLAAVVFNRSPAVLVANITWAMLGVPSSQVMVLTDLWEHSPLGEFTGHFEARVPPHDVLLFRAAKA